MLHSICLQRGITRVCAQQLPIELSHRFVWSQPYMHSHRHSSFSFLSIVNNLPIATKPLPKQRTPLLPQSASPFVPCQNASPFLSFHAPCTHPLHHTISLVRYASNLRGTSGTFLPPSWIASTQFHRTHHAQILTNYAYRMLTGLIAKQMNKSFLSRMQSVKSLHIAQNTMRMRSQKEMERCVAASS